MTRDPLPSPVLELAVLAQQRARSEDFAAVEQLLDRMDAEARRIGSRAAVAGALALRGDLFGRLRRFDEAFLAFDSAVRAAEGDEYLIVYVESQRLTALLRKDPLHPGLLDAHLDHVERLRGLGDRAMLADTLSNAALLLAQAERLDEATACWEEAAVTYDAVNRHQQAADCRGAIAGMLRARENDEEALRRYDELLRDALRRRDAPAVARVGGDYARTLVCQLMERKAGPEEQLVGRASEAATIAAQARELVDLVDDAELFLWQQARAHVDGAAARLARGLELFNNVETALLLDLHLERHWTALSRSTMTKSRVLADDLVERVNRGIEILAPDHVEIQRSLAEFRGPNGVPFLMDAVARRSGQRLVAIDHFGLSANQLCVSLYSSPGEEIGEGTVFHWTADVEDKSTAGALHGAHQIKEPRRRLALVLDDFERIASRLPYIVPADATRIDDASIRTSLAEELDTVRPHLRALGDYFFPAEVRALLRDAKVEHVVLSPDPRLFHVPWLALEFSDGTALIDEPWTLSLTPSLALLYTTIAHPPELAPGVLVASPDREVTATLGGQASVALLRAEFGASALVDGAATLTAWAEAVRGSGLAHVVSHGDEELGTPGTLPLFADGLWRTPIMPVLEHRPVLVTIACRTGTVSHTAQDIFGMYDIALRSGFSAIIAPTIAVDGVVALQALRPFYEALSRGANLSSALRDAARAGREAFVHPSIWGAFLLVGDHAMRLPRLQATSADASPNT